MDDTGAFETCDWCGQQMGIIYLRNHSQVCEDCAMEFDDDRFDEAKDNQVEARISAYNARHDTPDGRDA